MQLENSLQNLWQYLTTHIHRAFLAFLDTENKYSIKSHFKVVFFNESGTDGHFDSLEKPPNMQENSFNAHIVGDFSQKCVHYKFVKQWPAYRYSWCKHVIG